MNGFAAFASAIKQATEAINRFGFVLSKRLELEAIIVHCESISPGFMRNFKPSSYADPIAVAHQVYRLLCRGEEEAALRILEAD